jgi:hypothetical protein
MSDSDLVLSSRSFMALPPIPMASGFVDMVPQMLNEWSAQAVSVPSSRRSLPESCLLCLQPSYPLAGLETPPGTCFLLPFTTVHTLNEENPLVIHRKCGDVSVYSS